MTAQRPVVPRGVRLNNPGNVRKSNTRWQGKTAGKDTDFETFDSPEHGIRALTRILLTYYRMHELRTVKEIIERWAPPNENNTGAYIASVARYCGVSPAQVIDLESDEIILRRMVTAIIRHENGCMPYKDTTIVAGIDMALS
jgi:hypothetical protein